MTNVNQRGKHAMYYLLHAPISVFNSELSPLTLRRQLRYLKPWVMCAEISCCQNFKQGCQTILHIYVYLLYHCQLGVEEAKA